MINEKKPGFNLGLFNTVIRRIVKMIFHHQPMYTSSRPGRKFRVGQRSVFIRVVDCGSSNATEQEILAMFNPVYDAERLGFHLVASPRHADLLLITGPVTRNMREALLTTFQAMPEPRRVITVGDDIAENSVFQHSYAIVPLPDEICAVCIAHIPGDPPTPEQLLEALLKVT